MFQGNFFAGSALCAYDRAAMLAGNPNGQSATLAQSFTVNQWLPLKSGGAVCAAAAGFDCLPSTPAHRTDVGRLRFEGERWSNMDSMKPTFFVAPDIVV